MILKQRLSRDEEEEVTKYVYPRVLSTWKMVWAAVRSTNEHGSPLYALIDTMVAVDGVAYAPLYAHDLYPLYSEVGRVIKHLFPEKALEDEGLVRAVKHAEARHGAYILPDGRAVVFRPVPIKHLRHQYLRALTEYVTPIPARRAPFVRSLRRMGYVTTFAVNGERYAVLRDGVINEVLAAMAERARWLACYAATDLEAAARSWNYYSMKLRLLKTTVESWLGGRFVPLPGILRAVRDELERVLGPGGGPETAAEAAERLFYFVRCRGSP